MNPELQVFRIARLGQRQCLCRFGAVDNLAGGGAEDPMLRIVVTQNLLQMKRLMNEAGDKTWFLLSDLV